MHKTVLLQESIDGLDLRAGKTFLDGTFGGGGHSREAKKRLGDDLRIIGLDKDPEVIKNNPDFDVRSMSFAKLDELDVHPDAILLDLGISSIQIENSGRGFSFQKDEPLDMRMSDSGITATDILNSWDEHAIELILRGFGEEKYSRKIARAIVLRREVKPFSNTADLVELISTVRPKSFKEKINPATKTFQALRIAVNEELTALEQGLEKGFEALKPGGRFAVISFHSLEDRIVKNFFRDRVKEGVGEFINKKPIIASDEEVTANPRSRSAKLRIIKKNV